MTDHPSLSEQRALSAFVAYSRDLGTLLAERDQGVAQTAFEAGWKAHEAAFAQPPASGVDRSRKAVVDNLDNTLRTAVIKAEQHSQWRLGSIEWRRETAGDIADAILALTNSGAPVPGDGRPAQAWIDRAAQIESAARALLEGVDDLFKRADRGSGRLYAANRSVLEDRCDQLALAVNTPEPPLAHAAPAPSDEAGEFPDLTDDQWEQAKANAPKPNGPLTEIASFEAGVPAGMVQPIDMLLFCPKCGIQHIDWPDDRSPDWDNPQLRSHLCHACGCIWRPADVPTNGVAAITTQGKADTWGESNSAYTPKQATPTDEAVLDIAQIGVVESEQYADGREDERNDVLDHLRAWEATDGDIEPGWLGALIGQIESGEHFWGEAARPAPGSAGEASDV